MALALGSAGHLFPDCINGPLASNAVCNNALSIGDRARGLVSALETDEKYSLLINTSPGVERLGLPNYEWWRMHLFSFSILILTHGGD